MKESIRIKAYAKVNLQLDVLGRRDDGYHELAGVMQSVSLYDEVFLRLLPSSAENSVLTVDFDEPVPYNNTVRRAAEKYLNGFPCELTISVRKHIPSEAGLGGASADAAAVLRGLNALFAGTELEKTEAQLAALGLAVGADVPFCLMGGCAEAKGVGELLAPLPNNSLRLLIVKGRRGVSTGRLFGFIDSDPASGAKLPEASLDGIKAAVAAGDIAAVGEYMRNALQPAAEVFAPEIADYTARMRSCGALGACMTGSGAAVAGLFPDEASAHAAKAEFTDCPFAEVCRTVDAGTEMF